MTANAHIKLELLVGNVEDSRDEHECVLSLHDRDSAALLTALNGARKVVVVLLLAELEVVRVLKLALRESDVEGLFTMQVFVDVPEDVLAVVRLVEVVGMLAEFVHLDWPFQVPVEVLFEGLRRCLDTARNEVNHSQLRSFNLQLQDAL